MTQDYAQAFRLSVAPMMDWTDRHCRVFHRQLSRRAELYTEMVTAPAVIHGDRDRLLGYDATEHPVVLQLGGSDPAQLAEAAKIGADYGYDRINLNCGCPSDRVQSGCFGAVLMESPQLVADCAAAMIAAQGRPVTIKCRIGVDEQVAEEILPNFIETVAAAGVTHFVVHARKAWLKGLSPKENREIPPLNYPLAIEMKRAFPQLEICLNGGIATLSQVPDFLAQGLDGVMIGRTAYHDPAHVLLGADSLLWGDEDPVTSALEAATAMRPYIANHLQAGGRLHHITRHMLGLFTAQRGARRWRRMLSEAGGNHSSGLAEYDAAIVAVAEELRLAAEAELAPSHGHNTP